VNNRYNDDTHAINKRQMFAWDVNNKGDELHLQADPTMTEMMHKRHVTAKETFKSTQAEGVLARYGGEEHLKVPPKELLIAQSEHYTEYSKAGRLLKGAEEAITRSKYEEDVFPGNHRTIWGSFWRQGRWGFACCHSFVKESYCTGEAGKLAAAASQPIAYLEGANGEAADEEAEPEEAPKSMVELHKEKLSAEAAEEKAKKKAKKGKKGKKRDHADANSSGSGTESEDEEEQKAKRIKEIMKRQEREEHEAADTLKLDERDRKYGAMGKATSKPSDEEMEAYRLRQVKADDPLANFGDELL
jgi:pre-mRNA-processing factor SLU7